MHDRIYIWDYNVNFSHYLAPMPNLDVIAANIRFWVTNHVEGVDDAGRLSGAGRRDELKSWVASKLLWDPSRDEKALTQDFIWGHYGHSRAGHWRNTNHCWRKCGRTSLPKCRRRQVESVTDGRPVLD